MKKCLNIFFTAPIPYPAAPDFPLKGKRLTTFCASLTLLQNVFAVHPRESVSLGSQVPLLPYEPSSPATLKKGQNTPLYAFLKNHMSQCPAPMESPPQAAYVLIAVRRYHTPRAKGPSNLRHLGAKAPSIFRTFSLLLSGIQSEIGGQR